MGIPHHEGHEVHEGEAEKALYALSLRPIFRQWVTEVVHLVAGGTLMMNLEGLLR